MDTPVYRNYEVERVIKNITTAHEIADSGLTEAEFTFLCRMNLYIGERLTVDPKDPNNVKPTVHSQLGYLSANRINYQINRLGWKFTQIGPIKTTLGEEVTIGQLAITEVITRFTITEI